MNSKDASENTTLMVAAALGHNVVLAVILAHPLLNIQAGVSLSAYYTVHCTTGFLFFFRSSDVLSLHPMHVPVCVYIHAGCYRQHCTAVCYKCQEEQVCQNAAGGRSRPLHCRLHCLHSTAPRCRHRTLPVSNSTSRAWSIMCIYIHLLFISHYVLLIASVPGLHSVRVLIMHI